MTSGEPGRNWSRTVTYAAQRVAHPGSVAELGETVAAHPRVKALGSRHSFSPVADTDGVQVALDAMPDTVAVDRAAMVAEVPAGTTYADLSAVLAGHDLAVPNLASLPHISLGGAIATGTHGSGTANPGLAAHVEALHLIGADGVDRVVSRGDDDFAALVVGLGAFGVVHRVRHRVVPAFEVAQRVWVDVAWGEMLDHFEEVMSCAYSVSLFTRWDTPDVAQIWTKQRTTDPEVDLSALGAREATRTLHPLPELDAEHVTAQAGVPGPSWDRLPHFRAGFQPSSGDEIQSEYLLDARHAVPALQAVRGLGARLAPLLHVSEVRRVAADDAWLSPSGGRDSVALHFTWLRRPEEVRAVLPVLEAALAPYDARPHWGKVSTYDADALRRVYPRLPDAARLAERLDPAGRFHNAFLRAAGFADR